MLRTFDPDYLALHQQDNTLKVLDAQTGQKLLALKGLHGNHSIAFSPDGHRLASRGPDATPQPEKPKP